MRRHLLVIPLVLGLAAPLAAQTESNLYLPIDSWTTPYVEHLIRAGVLQGLDPLTRPLKRADVARAIAAVDTTDLPASARGTLRLLAHELGERADSVRWKLDGGVALLGASDASRWAWRPSRDSAGVFPQADLAFSLEMPHFALVTHPRVENRLKYDPEYVGKKDRFVAGRNDEAYLLASWKYLEVFYGLADRNWGTPEVEGLLLSPSPYAFDHLFLRIGPRRLRLELIATELNDLPFFTDSGFSAQLARRFLSLHRLVVMPSRRLSFSLSEAMLYASTGSVGRSFEPWYLNPLNLWLLAQYQGKTTGNSLLAADVSYQLRSDLRLFGQLYLDDFQVDRRQSADREPPGYGFTLNATGGQLVGVLHQGDEPRVPHAGERGAVHQRLRRHRAQSRRLRPVDGAADHRAGTALAGSGGDHVHPAGRRRHPPPLPDRRRVRRLAVVPDRDGRADAARGGPGHVDAGLRGEPQPGPRPPLRLERQPRAGRARRPVGVAGPGRDPAPRDRRHRPLIPHPRPMTRCPRPVGRRASGAAAGPRS
jgi:hypothetical protein